LDSAHDLKFNFFNDKVNCIVLKAPLGGIGVNLSFGDYENLHKKVSPPFEGGVAGKIDYHIYTAILSPAGVVDSLISSYLYWYEKPKPL
jgi:hypothetical protein